MSKIDFFRRRLQDFDCCTEETRRMRLEVLKDIPAASGFRAFLLRIRLFWCDYCLKMAPKRREDLERRISRLERDASPDAEINKFLEVRYK